MTELNVSLLVQLVSNAIHLQCGVPQSSVLGPRLYCIFAKPISEICRRLIHTLTSDKQVSRRLDIFFQLSSGLITRYSFVHLSVIGITLMTKTCKNKQVQLQSHATFKFAISDVIDRTPQKMRAKH
jgi:hypothetical protein